MNRTTSPTPKTRSSGFALGGLGFIAPLLQLALVLSGCSGGDSGRNADGDGLLVIQGGWLLDGTGADMVENPGIIIQDSLVLTVGMNAESREASGATVIQLSSDDYILPGLFDLHAHYATDFYGEGRTDDVDVYPGLFLANGVTSTYPAGEVNPAKMFELRLRLESGEQVGPRLFNSGPYYGTARKGWDQEMTAEQIRAEVDSLFSQGVRHFKAKGIRPHHLQALIDAAHAHGGTVAGHLGSGYRNTVNPRDAILMGIDRVEHFLGGDAMPSDRSAYASLAEMTPDMPEVESISRMYIEEGVFFDATLTAYGYYGERDPEVFTYFEPEMDYLSTQARGAVEAGLPRQVSDQFEKIYWAKRKLIKAFYDHGGGDWITLGTDHPSWGEYISPFSVHRELHAMVLAGLPPEAALQAATINAARALNVDDRLGTLEPGKLADLVIISGNPLEDIRNTRNAHTVIKAGQAHRSRELMESAKGKLAGGDPTQLP